MKNVWVWKLLFAVSMAQIAFVCSLAFGDPAAVFPVPTTDAQAFDVFGSLWNFVVTKQYAAVVGPALTLVVWALRKWDTKIPKVGPAIDAFLNKPFVAFLLPTVISGIAGFVTALATKHSFVDALGAVWAASSTAIMTYVGLKKVGEQMAAGTTAAAGVVTKTDAINELKKP